MHHAAVEAPTEDPGWPLSPLDGRYRKQTFPLAWYLSEDGLNRLRLYIEVEWLIFASENGVADGPEPLTTQEVESLRGLPRRFGDVERGRLAVLEAETRHDVKAVEYLLREHLAATGIQRFEEAAHLLCTSEDINNLAVALGIQGAVQNVWLPAARSLAQDLAVMATDLKDQPMLARTHGQSATPTTVGKELAVFVWRLQRVLKRISSAEYLGKFNGATGTYSAHQVVVPDADWLTLSREFVEQLGLTWNPLTTQIESHDWQAELYSDIAHFNRICHNLATDMWSYISLGYFRQELAAQGSTGSSTMPHKVNPIRFENAESNLELSNSFLELFTQVLTTSRLQRDLSDSSTQRNVGVALGHSLVAVDNLRRGLAGLTVDAELLKQELSEHWEVLSEAIQQAMRVATLRRGGLTNDGDAAPYELLKELTRGRQVDASDLARLLEELDLPDEVRKTLQDLSPMTYTGLAPDLAGLVTAD